MTANALNANSALQRRQSKWKYWGLLVLSCLCLNATKVQAQQQTIAIPSYYYPDQAGGSGQQLWDRTTAVAPTVGLVIINPGIYTLTPAEHATWDDPNYRQQINDCRAVGQLVIGYTTTKDKDSNGNPTILRDIDAVKADIDLFYNLFAMDGIFLDEVDVDPALVPTYYQPLYDHIKSKGGQAITALNPGRQTDEAYMAACDIMVNFEGFYSDPGPGVTPSPGAWYKDNYLAPSWVSNYGPDRFWHLIHTTGTIEEMQHAVKLSKERNASWVYVTPVAMPPWHTLPHDDASDPYFSAELTAVRPPSGPPNYQAVAAPDGLVGWWSGEGSADDLVGGNNGTINMAPGSPFSPFTVGRVGKGFNLGFGGYADHIALGTGPAISGTSAFAVEAWVATTDAQGVIVQQRGSAYNGQYVLSVGSIDGAFAGAPGTVSWSTYGDGQFGFNFSSQSRIDDGLFHHIVAVREADGTGKIYIDGVLDNQQSAPSRTLVPIEVYIGADMRNNAAFLKGIVDEVSIYNRALTATEAAAIHAAGSAGKVLVPQGIDLITTAVSSATSAQSLEQVTYNVTVKNQGDVDVDSQVRFKIGAYVSTDAVITKQDSLVGGLFIYGLAAGADTSVQISGTMPRYADGPHYVGAIANYHAIGVAEADTTNNALVGHTIDITQVFPDLITTAVSGASSAASQQVMEVDVTVKNIGPISVHSQERFRVGVYLSTDPVITTDDTPIGAQFNYGLEPGLTESMPITVSIPAGVTGNYFLGAIANYHSIGVLEGDLTNNSLVGHPITIHGAPTAPPVLVSPIDDAAVDTTTVTMTWNGVTTAAEYRLWLDETDANGVKQTILDTVVDGTSLTRILTDGYHYDWWVLGLNAAGEGPWSPKESFVISPPAPPAPPVLVSPIGNAAVGGATVTLEWHPVADAAQYGVWVSDGDVAGNVALIDIVVDGTLSANGTLTYAMTAPACATCDWWIQGINAAGEGPWSVKETYTMPGEAAKTVAVPQAFALRPNHPNPFNPSTHISYQLPQAGPVTLVVYNAMGQKIRVLEQSDRPAGVHQLSWDGRDDRGQAVAGGVYLYRLQSGAFSQTRRMLLLK